MSKNSAGRGGVKGKSTAAQKRQLAAAARQIIARNRRALHDYDIQDRFEAGMVLTGTEVKALRMGRASLVDGWVEIAGSEAWLHGVNIPMYSQGSWNNHAPTRKRKLLLHRAEILKLGQRVQAKGMALVPLELYFVNGRAKVEIGLGQGKRDWDKRQSLREAQDKREAERAMKRYVRRPRH